MVDNSSPGSPAPPGPSGPLDLSIIIVSFNARADLERCLASLHREPPATSHEIIVVDNQSGDGSAAAARRWSGVRVVETGGNLGFARANNVGIRASRGTNLLLLNSDTIVPPGSMAVEERTKPGGGRSAPGRRRRACGAVVRQMIGPFNELRQKVVRGQQRNIGVIAALVDAPQTGRASGLGHGAASVRDTTRTPGLLDERISWAETSILRRHSARGRRADSPSAVTVAHPRIPVTARAATDAAYRQPAGVHESTTRAGPLLRGICVCAGSHSSHRKRFPARIRLLLPAVAPALRRQPFRGRYDSQAHRHRRPQATTSDRDHIQPPQLPDDHDTEFVLRAGRRIGKTGAARRELPPGWETAPNYHSEQFKMWALKREPSCFTRPLVLPRLVSAGPS